MSTDMVQQAAAGIFDKIKRLCETFFTAIVGIGYNSGIMLSAEFRQTPELGTHRRRTDLFRQSQIIPVHGQQ
jgi:hypothetical protein